MLITFKKLAAGLLLAAAFSPALFAGSMYKNIVPDWSQGEYNYSGEFVFGRTFKSYKQPPRDGLFVDEENDYFSAGYLGNFNRLEIDNVYSERLSLGLGFIDMNDATNPNPAKSQRDLEGRFTSYFSIAVGHYFGWHEFEYGFLTFYTFSDQQRTYTTADGTKQRNDGAVIDTRYSFVYPSLTWRLWPRSQFGWAVEFLGRESNVHSGWLSSYFWLHLPEENSRMLLGFEFLSQSNIHAKKGLPRLSSAVFMKYEYIFGVVSAGLRLRFIIDSAQITHEKVEIGFFERFSPGFYWKIQF